MADKSYQLAIEIAAKDIASSVLKKFGDGLDDAGKKASGLGGILKNALSFAAGGAILGGIQKLGGALAGTVAQAWDATASYEKMAMSMQSLAKTEIIMAGQVRETVKVGTARVQITEKEQKELDKLQKSIADYQFKLQKAAVTQSEWTSKTKESTKMQMAENLRKWNAELAAATSRVAQLTGKQGALVDITKTVVRQTISDADAKKQAAERAKELLAWSQKLAIVSPFSQEDVSAALKTAMALGFTSKEAQGLTETMVDFAAATGSSGQVINQVSLALGQIKGKGKLAGQEMLQLVNAGIPVREILAEGFGVTTDAIGDMMEQGLLPADKTIKVIADGLKTRFGGAAKESSATLDGMKNSLMDLKSVALRELFGGIFEAIKPFMGQAIDALTNPAVLGKIQDVGKRIGAVAAGIAQGLSNAVQTIGPIVQEAVLLVQAVVDAFKFGDASYVTEGGFLMSIAPAIEAVVAAIITLQNTLAMGGGAWDALNNAIGTFLESIGASQAAQTFFLDFFYKVGEAVTNAGAFIQSNLIPILAGLGAMILDMVVPAVITFATTTIPAAVTAFGAWIASAGAAAVATMAAVGPVLLIGAAVGVLAAAWLKDWGGIRTFMTAFWNNTLKPIVEQIVKWFQDNIPKAIAALSKFWTNTLLPAIRTVANWITSTLWPILQTLWNWLATNIPAALATLANFWNNVLLPAIRAVWGFIQNSLIPLFMAIVNVWFSAMNLALTVLAGIWQNVLLPALQAVGGFITGTVVPAIQSLITWLGDNLIPIVQSVVSWFQDKLMPATQSVADKVNGPLKTALDWLANTLLPPLKTALEAIPGIMQKITNWFGTFADKLDALKGRLPAWLTPGSPTPLEIGIRGIADALTQVIPLIEDMAAALTSVSDVAPETANMPGWMAGFKAMIESMVSTLGSLYDAPNGPKANAINLAKRLAEELSGVIAAVSDAANALVSLQDVDLAKLGIEKIDALIAFIHEMLFQIQEEAATWGETEAAIKAGFALARKMVDQILDLVRIVEPATAAMAALGETALEDVELAAVKWSWIITGVLVICNNLAAIAKNLDITGYPAAALAAEAINKIIVLVEPATSAIAMLGQTALEDVTGATYKWSWIITGVLVICNNLALIAARLDMSGYPAAEKFAESAGKIIAIVESAVSALAALVRIEFPSFSSFGAMAFGLQKMLEYIYEVFEQWAARLTELANMASFSENAQKVIALIQPVLEMLKALVAIEFPSLGSFGVMAFGLQKALEYLKAVFVQWKDNLEELGRMAGFADNAQKVVGLVQPVLDMLKALVTLEFPPLGSFGVMAFGLQKALEAVEIVFKQWEAELERVAGMATFSESAQKALGIIKAAIESIAAIGEYKEAKGLPTKILNFAQDLDMVLRGLKAVSELWVKVNEDGTLDSTVLAAIALFSSNVQQAVGFIEPAINAIKTLAAYKAAEKLTKRMDEFTADVITAVGKIKEMATNPALSAEVLAAATTFATNLGTLTSTMSGAIKGLGEILSYKGYSASSAMTRLQGDIDKMLVALGQIVNNLAGQLGVEKAGKFEAAMLAIKEAITRGLGHIAALSGTDATTGAEGALTAFAGACKKSMGDALAYVKQGLTDIQNAFNGSGAMMYAAGYAAGLALGNGVKAGLQAALSLLSPPGGNNSRVGSGAPTTNNNYTINVQGTGSASRDLRTTVTALQMAGTA